MPNISKGYSNALVENKMTMPWQKTNIDQQAKRCTQNKDRK